MGPSNGGSRVLFLVELKSSVIILGSDVLKREASPVSSGSGLKTSKRDEGKSGGRGVFVVVSSRQERRIEQWPIVRLSTVSRPGGEPGPNNSISTLLEEENLRWRFILPPSSPFFFHGHVKCISIFSPLPIEFFIEHALSFSLSLSL